MQSKITSLSIFLTTTTDETGNDIIFVQQTRTTSSIHLLCNSFNLDVFPSNSNCRPQTKLRKGTVCSRIGGGSACTGSGPGHPLCTGTLFFPWPCPSSVQFPNPGAPSVQVSVPRDMFELFQLGPNCTVPSPQTRTKFREGNVFTDVCPSFCPQRPQVHHMHYAIGHMGGPSCGQIHPLLERHLSSCCCVCK